MVCLHSKTLIKTETKIDNHLLSWFKIHHYTPLWIFSVDDEMPSIIQMCFYFYLRWNVFCLKIFNIVSLAYIFEVLVIKYCKEVLWSCIFGFISDSWLFFFWLFLAQDMGMYLILFHWNNFLCLQILSQLIFCATESQT